MILLRLFKVYRVEALGDFKIITEGLFRGNDRIGSFWANFDNQKLMIFIRIDAFDLADRKNHAILPVDSTVKFKSLLANPFDSIGSS